MIHHFSNVVILHLIIVISLYSVLSGSNFIQDLPCFAPKARRHWRILSCTPGLSSFVPRWRYNGHSWRVDTTCTLAAVNDVIKMRFQTSFSNYIWGPTFHPGSFFKLLCTEFWHQDFEVSVLGVLSSWSFYLVEDRFWSYFFFTFASSLPLAMVSTNKMETPPPDFELLLATLLVPIEQVEVGFTQVTC